MSHTFDGTQQNWSTNERELYAIMWCLENCKQIIQGREIHVYTDHQNLPSILANNMTPKVERWSQRIALYDPKVHYLRGQDNVVADFFSKYVEDETPDHALFIAPAVKRRVTFFDWRQEEKEEKKRIKRVRE